MFGFRGNAVLAAAIAVLIGIGASAFAGEKDGGTQSAESQKTETFLVEDMTCGLCPITVRKAIERVPGVRSVSVDYDSKTATVLYDEARTSAAKIAAASSNAGYPAQAIEE